MKDKIRILICDDDKTDRILFRKYLNKNSKNKYELIEVSGANEFNSMLTDKSVSYDLIFLDYYLGDKTGLTLLKEIIIQNIAPVIMLTGRGDEETAVECMKEGAFDYLPKESLPEQNLWKIIEQALEKWEIKKERDQLLGIAAHELRNPISVILGYAEILKSFNDIDVEEQKEMLEVIKERSLHLLNIINGILDITRIEKGIVSLKKVNYDIVDLCRKISSEFKYASDKKGITILFESKLESLEIEIDPHRIREVISNLIDNAVKYSRSGTKITVKLIATDKNVRIDVCDQGQGIKESELKYLFELFSSKKISSIPTGEEQSTGIGLAICKKVIDAHNGQLLVESKPGKGSKFSVIL